MTSEAARVVGAYWDRFLAIEPLFATMVGDSRFDDALPDPGEDGRAERYRVHAGLLASADGIEVSSLSRRSDEHWDWRWRRRVVS